MIYKHGLFGWTVIPVYALNGPKTKTISIYFKVAKAKIEMRLVGIYIICIYVPASYRSLLAGFISKVAKTMVTL